MRSKMILSFTAFRDSFNTKCNTKINIKLVLKLKLAIKLKIDSLIFLFIMSDNYFDHKYDFQFLCCQVCETN